jgi:hypothetical protein
MPESQVEGMQVYGYYAGNARFNNGKHYTAIQLQKKSGNDQKMEENEKKKFSEYEVTTLGV